MAEPVSNELSTKEAVALTLMREIAFREEYANNPKLKRDQMLDLYAQCLVTVRTAKAPGKKGTSELG